MATRVWALPVSLAEEGGSLRKGLEQQAEQVAEEEERGQHGC